MQHGAATQAREMVEAVYRTESRAVLATLIRLLDDFDRAEEALHEAFRTALEQTKRSNWRHRFRRHKSAVSRCARSASSRAPARLPRKACGTCEGSAGQWFCRASPDENHTAWQARALLL